MAKVMGAKLPDPMRAAVESEAEGLGLNASQFIRIALVSLIDEAHERREDPSFYRSLIARSARARAS